MEAHVSDLKYRAYPFLFAALTVFAATGGFLRGN